MKKKELLTLINKTDRPHYYYLYKTYPLIFIVKRQVALLMSVQENKELKTYINNLYIKNQFIKRSYIEDNELCIIFNYHSLSKDQFNDFLNDFIDHLQSLNVKQVNHQTQQIEETKIVQLNHEIEIVSEKYFNEHKEVNEYKKSSHKGLISSIVFTLIPIVIWIAMHDIGYLIVLDGLLFGLCSYKGYHLYDEYFDKRDMISIYIVSIISLCVGELLSLPLIIKESFTNTLNVEISYLESFSLIPSLLLDVDILSSILIYIVTTLLLIIITIIILRKREKKKLNKIQNKIFIET